MRQGFWTREKIGWKKYGLQFYLSFNLILSAGAYAQHTITFGGELIPISNQFVAEKLMNIIKRMRSIANMPSIRSQANIYFPYIEYQLRAHGLPTDFKYLPIVESNFQLLTSKAGARGFWQLMPATAEQYGLVVNDIIDERDDIEKSTIAACRLIRDYYRYIYRTHNFYSWVLTAAAYNFGNGNITRAIRSQGSNYFTMNLNPETAQYVYKIIAVKELFENPELYMKNFGYNVFSQAAVAQRQPPPSPTSAESDADLESEFAELSITAQEEEITESVKPPNVIFIKANLKGNYKGYKDGGLIDVELQENLIAEGSYRRRGSIIRGKGYLIDDRVFVDLGFEHVVQLYDPTQVKGIPVKNLQNKARVLLRIETYD